MITTKTQKPNVVERLEGRVFMYGNKDTADTYLKTKEAIAHSLTTTYVMEVWYLAGELAEAASVEHEEPSTNLGAAEAIMYENKMKRLWKSEDRYRERESKTFRPILLQFALPLSHKLQQLADFNPEGNDAVIWSLSRVNDFAYGLHHDMVITLCGGPLSTALWEKAGFKGIEVMTNKGKLQTCVFLAGVSRAVHRHGPVELKDGFTASRDHYPAMVEYPMELPRFRMKTRGKITVLSNDKDPNDGGSQIETSFAQRRASQSVCHCCGESGYVAKKKIVQ